MFMLCTFCLKGVEGVAGVHRFRRMPPKYTA